MDAGTAGPRRRLSSSGGILSGPIDGPARTATQYPHREATPGLRVLHRASGFTGALVALDGEEVVLRGHTGLEKRYRNLPGTFAVEGTPTHLVPVRAPSEDDGPRVADGVRTASGSRAVVGAKARVAAGTGSGSRACTTPSWSSGCGATTCASRAIVVERLDGADGLADEVRDVRSRPGTPPRRAPRPPGRRARKEARLAAAVRHPHVLVTGHAVRRRVAGGAARRRRHRRVAGRAEGHDWKTGVCAALGVDDPRAMWQRILGSVHDWKQLEQPFVAAVEQLIDFLTE